MKKANKGKPKTQCPQYNKKIEFKYGWSKMFTVEVKLAVRTI